MICVYIYLISCKYFIHFSHVMLFVNNVVSYISLFHLLFIYKISLT